VKIIISIITIIYLYLTKSFVHLDLNYLNPALWDTAERIIFIVTSIFFIILIATNKLNKYSYLDILSFIMIIIIGYFLVVFIYSFVLWDISMMNFFNWSVIIRLITYICFFVFIIASIIDIND
jgi:hypothetical protein